MSTTHGVKIGDVAGSVNNQNYRKIGIDCCRYNASRLAWLYVIGKWPQGEIDHKNNIHDDDRFSNLRDTTHSENMQNQRNVRSDNVSGIIGAHAFRGQFGSKTSVARNMHYLTPDATAQLDQLRHDCKAVRVDISAARAAGADPQLIDMARRELYYVFKLTVEAIEKGR